MRKITLSILFFSLLSAQMVAQPIFERAFDIPVFQDEKQIEFAWLGGLKNPQFNKADLNNNGVEDLVVFDRAGNFLMTFLNDNIPGEVSYTYAPEYVAGFPMEGTPRVQNWMLMTDFSCNGIADLFVSGIGRIEYFRGYYDNDTLKFDYVDFLRYQGFSGPLNIFVSTVDYPTIVDVNGDGAKDVLAFHMLGGYVQYFKNLSMDTHENCDGNLVFEAADNCWGDFFEGATKKGVQFLDTCVGLFQPPFEIPETRRHAGSTLLALDLNNSGSKDLILGDVEYSNLTMLINGGTPDSAKMVYQDSLFPSYDVPVDLPTMPVAFHIDVDNDGLKDLIVSPSDLFTPTENIENAWLYKNVGNQDTAIFELQTKTFIGGEMLDAGAVSRPVFADVTGNGVPDLIIGNNGYYAGVQDGIFTRRAALTLYENTGTISNPEFTLKTRDFAQLSQLEKDFLSPAFGDLTGDGKKELVVGDENGNIHLFVNTADIGEPSVYVLENLDWLVLPWTFSSPTLYDVNDNGILDLVIGERQGSVKLHLNEGTAENPTFSNAPHNMLFGQIDTRKQGFFDGYAAPVFMETDKGIFIISGSEERGLLLHAFDKDSIFSGKFQLVVDDYAQVNTGRRIAPATYQINGETAYLIVGNWRGGLQLYKNSDSIISNADSQPTTQVLTNELSLFPNPANEILAIQSKHVLDADAELIVYDVSGKKVNIGRAYMNHAHQFQINIAHLSPGMYFIELRLKNSVSRGRFIKSD